MRDFAATLMGPFYQPTHRADDRNHDDHAMVNHATLHGTWCSHPDCFPMYRGRHRHQQPS